MHKTHTRKYRAESNKGVLRECHHSWEEKAVLLVPPFLSPKTREAATHQRWGDGAWFDLKSRWVECNVCRLIMLYGESECWVFSNLKASQSSRPCWKPGGQSCMFFDQIVHKHIRLNAWTHQTRGANVCCLRGRRSWKGQEASSQLDSWKRLSDLKVGGGDQTSSAACSYVL